ncbi:helix-turn-helix transcriptional regulator [Streptomyces sp. NBC_00134]|uniref:helix-turn-helix domain-containing protein n=1 Tax=Streptomyces sp. NBC_00134 TaxID=2975663 RepID=UPI002F916898
MAEGPTTRRRQMAAELRRLRDLAGMNLEDAGRAVGVSRATVNRYEALEPGKSSYGVKWPIVDALCRTYGATDAEREAVVSLAKDSKVQGWWKTQSDVVPEHITPLLVLEDEAAEELHWANTYVPGLLQTRAYATAVIEATETRAEPDDIKRMVDVRLRRQEVLKRQPPMHVWAILDEAVLRRTVGGPAVMAEQLAHLVTSGRTANIDVQVLPFEAGAHAAESTAFMVVRGAEPSLDVVHTSNLTGALYLEKPADLERHRIVFEYLRSQALDTSRSSVMIAAISAEYAARASRKE